MTSQFDMLRGELEALNKAAPMKGDDDAADPKIAAAAAAAGGPGDEEEEEGEEEAAPPARGKGKGKPFGKSMTVTLEDGTEVEAEDGTALVKSLTESLGALTTRIDDNDSVLAKAFGEAVTLLKSQGTAIAAMQAQIKAMAGEGRGRKAVVNLVDKPNVGGAQADGGSGLTPDAIMAKATSMCRQGKLLGNELAYVETSFNRGNFALPPELLNKIVSAA